MPKNNFGNESNYNKGAGQNQRKSLKKLADSKVPNINKPNQIPVKQGKDINPLPPTPKKIGENINKFGQTPEKPSVDINKLKATPQKPSVDINKSEPTPEKPSVEINKFGQTPEKSSVEINKSEPTPEKPSVEINKFGQTPEKPSVEINKSEPTPEKPSVEINNLSNISGRDGGISVSDLDNIRPFNRTSIKDVEDFTPQTDNDVINKPFSTISFKNIKNYSPILDNDKIGEVDFMGNENAPGFVKNFDEGSVTKYVEDSSNRDLGSDFGVNVEYNPINKYGDTFTSSPLGKLWKDGPESAENSTNPLVQNHLDDIGKIVTPDSPNNVSQEVNFLSWVSGDFGPNTLPIGFSQFQLFKNTFFFNNTTESDNSTFPTELDNLLDYRKFDFVSDDNEDLYNQTSYDPRYPGRQNVPTHTDPGIKNSNQYKGSSLDELTDYQKQDFVSKSEEGTIVDNYNSLNYDWRDRDRLVLTDLPPQLGSSGQTKVRFYNPQNAYEGSTLDNLMPLLFNPLAQAEEIGLDITNYSFINDSNLNAEQYPFGVVGDNPDILDNQSYDPRAFDFAGGRNVDGFENLTAGGPLGADGQKKIFYSGVQNTYVGSQLDPPIIQSDNDGNPIHGGGVFNDKSKPYGGENGVNEFAGNPYPTMLNVVSEGNFDQWKPGKAQSYAQNDMVVKSALDKYTTTSNQEWPLGFDEDGIQSLGESQGTYLDGINPILGESLGDSDTRINMSDGSWWFNSGIQSGMPITNGYLETAMNNFIPQDGDTRTITVNLNSVTASVLGTGGLTYGSMYSSTGSLSDSRLQYGYVKYGWFSDRNTENISPLFSDVDFQKEPYRFSSMSERVSDSLFDSSNFGDELGNRPGYNVSTTDRVEQDKLRLKRFMNSNAGGFFIGKMQNLFSQQARNYQHFDKDAIIKAAGGEFSTHSSLNQGGGRIDFLLPDQELYMGTVFENVVRPFGFNFIGGNWYANDITDLVLKIHNETRSFDKPFMGGNAFQIMALNAFGLTDPTNVSPAGQGNLLERNLANAAFLATRLITGGKEFLITDRGSLPSFSNPRGLFYTQKNIAQQSVSIPIGGDTIVQQKYSDDDPASFNKLAKQDLQGNSSKPWETNNATNLKNYYRGFNRHQPSEDNKLEYIIGTQDGWSDSGKLKVDLGDYSNIPDDQEINGKVFKLSGLTARDKYGGSGYPDNMDSRNKQPFKKNQNLRSWGDVYTVAPILAGNTVDEAYGDDAAKLESETSGMPFYFKDLRDNSYVYFRGFIYGLIEQLNSRWMEEMLIGRSEPVYGHESTTRELNFTFKLVAQNRHELDMMYDKLNKLTSLLYPQYLSDNVNFSNKLRSRPPLCKIRIGELFGRKDEELTGFIRNLTNTISEMNSYETTEGSRVPRIIDVNVSFQVIHRSTPHMLTKFYGKKYSTIVHNLTGGDLPTSGSFNESADGGGMSVGRKDIESESTELVSGYINGSDAGS